MYPRLTAAQHTQRRQLVLAAIADAAAAGHTQRRQLVLAAIADAAAAGQVCPSNSDLARLIGLRSPAAVTDILKDMRRLGLIEVEIFGQQRIVTICSSGRSTALPGPLEHRHARTTLSGRATPRFDFGQDNDGYARLTGDEIARRAEAAEADRRARERHWLDLEARKYGLAQPARPLSEMAV